MDRNIVELSHSLLGVEYRVIVTTRSELDVKKAVQGRRSRSVELGSRESQRSDHKENNF